MTAIDAAIIELEAHREHVSKFITELRRLARVIEDAHGGLDEGQGHATRTLSDHLDAAVGRSQPLSVAIAAPARPSNGVNPAPGSSHDAIVLRALTTAGEPVSYGEIGTPHGLTKDEVRQALGRLVDAKRVVKTGKTNATRFAIATPRPGAVAGTQAAPPVGPPPANGTPPREGPQVVWNGTKERAGQSPTILPPRERKP